VSVFSVTVQVEVPLHPPPLQPAKIESLAGVGVRVTTLPLPKEAKQVEPQEIPIGLLATDPLPGPALFTPKVTGGTGGTKLIIDCTPAISSAVGNSILPIFGAIIAGMFGSVS
jgi:hypothetical protein